jgi:hypothetical protein
MAALFAGTDPDVGEDPRRLRALERIAGYGLEAARPEDADASTAQLQALAETARLYALMAARAHGRLADDAYCPAFPPRLATESLREYAGRLNDLAIRASASAQGLDRHPERAGELALLAEARAAADAARATLDHLVHLASRTGTAPLAAPFAFPALDDDEDPVLYLDRLASMVHQASEAQAVSLRLTMLRLAERYGIEAQGRDVVRTDTRPATRAPGGAPSELSPLAALAGRPVRRPLS